MIITRTLKEWFDEIPDDIKTLDGKRPLRDEVAEILSQTPVSQQKTESFEDAVDLLLLHGNKLATKRAIDRLRYIGYDEFITPLNLEIFGFVEIEEGGVWDYQIDWKTRLRYMTEHKQFVMNMKRVGSSGVITRMKFTRMYQINNFVKCFEHNNLI